MAIGGFAQMQCAIVIARADCSLTSLSERIPKHREVCVNGVIIFLAEKKSDISSSHSGDGACTRYLRFTVSPVCWCATNNGHRGHPTKQPNGCNGKGSNLLNK